MYLKTLHFILQYTNIAKIRLVKKKFWIESRVFITDSQ